MAPNGPSDGQEGRDGPLLVFAGGGSGGHLYPAIALAEALREAVPAARFLFLATRRPIDRRILTREGFRLIEQPLSDLRRAPWSWPAFAIGVARAARMCRRLFRDDRPAAVVGTGGLACVPAVRVARKRGIPTALLNPDVIPGRANRFLASAVDRVFVQWPQSVSHLPAGARAVVAGCPVRRRFKEATRDEGIARFGLDPERKTLLITGASQGSRSVNRAALANLPFVEALPDWQVVHLTGVDEFETVQDAYERRSIRAVVLAYTDRMPQALAAADLVIARAGASFLAELTVAGKPSILMPYPYHADRHQWLNARCLADAGAARILTDRVDPDLNASPLRELLQELMGDDRLRRDMSAAAGGIARPDAAAVMAAELLALADARL